MPRRPFRLATLASAVAFLAAAACHDANAPAPDPAAAVDVTRVPNEVDLGDTITPDVRVLDASRQVLAGHDRAISSSAPAVLKVLSDGRLVGLSAGTATLHVETTGDGGTVVADVPVTVARFVRHLFVTTPADTVYPTDTALVSALATDFHNAVVPTPTIRFASSDTNVAVIDPVSGLLVVRGDGNATITLTAGPTSSTFTLHGSLRRLTLPAAATAIAMSPFHGCAIVTGGAAYCWGASNVRMGNGSVAGSATPVLVSGGLQFASIDADKAGTCALTTDRAIYCWGDAAPGTNALVPTRVTLGDGSPVPASVRVSGNGGACAVTTAGAAWCWGSNTYLQFGRVASDASSNIITPRTVPLAATLAQFKPGFESSCGVATTGTLYCNGGVLRFSDGIGYDSGIPSVVAQPTTASRVAVNWRASCALDAAGAAWCGGANANGELGRGSADAVSHVFAPVATSLRFTQIKSSYTSTCALTATGELWCWGSLGDAVAQPKAINATPRLYSRVHHFVDFAVSARTACGITADGAVYCGTTTIGALPAIN